MKKMQLTPELELRIAELMLGALGELHGRHLSQVSNLETLGIFGLRALSGLDAVDLKKLSERAVDLVYEKEIEVKPSSVKEAILTLFNAAQLDKLGATFHILQ